MEGNTPSISVQPFGTTPEGAAVERFSLESGAGLTLRVLTFGATVQALQLPDAEGELADVVLGYATLEEYLAGNRAYLGSTIGRYANRIAGGRFTLDGEAFEISPNEGVKALHGGTVGFDKRVFAVDHAGAEPGRAVLRLSYLSPDGEMGFPGALRVTVTYIVSGENSVRIDYRATTDRTTVVNLTNHTYWNLSGEGAGLIDDHLLTIAARAYTPLDDELIPTGAVEPVAGTALDFTRAAAVGAQLRVGHPQIEIGGGGFDTNYVLDAGVTGSLDLAAELYDPASGRKLEIFTTEPAIQLYTGQHLDGNGRDKSGEPHRARSGIALETQHYPDSVNRPQFPPTTLEPGETFSSSTLWRLTSGPPGRTA